MKSRTRQQRSLLAIQYGTLLFHIAKYSVVDEDFQDVEKTQKEQQNMKPTNGCSCDVNDILE